MRKLEVKIDKPCSEKWESFDKRGLNAFCGSCEKVVVDFTKMSDREIKDYFLKMKDQEVCGRMRNNQQKEYLLDSPSRMKSFFSSALAASALIFASTPSIAQKNDRVEVLELQRKNPEPTKTRFVSGIVTDENGEPLPAVNVVIKGTVNGTQTDLEGRYKINISSYSALMYSFVGFDTQEVEVGSRSTIDISMDTSTTVLGGVAMLGGISSRWYTPRSLWWRIKGIFR